MPLGHLKIAQDAKINYVPLFSPLSFENGGGLRLNSDVGIRLISNKIDKHFGSDIISTTLNGYPNRNAVCLKIVQSQKKIG